jgi:hypothetical protein
MIVVAPTKKASFMMIFWNIIFIFFAFILNASVYGGGTGDFYEGHDVISLYLILKSIIMILLGICKICYGLVKKKITLTSLFWLAYGTLLLILIFNIGVPKNPPSDPRGWGNDEVKSIIYLMYFDCVVLILLSTVIGIVRRYRIR